MLIVESSLPMAEGHGRIPLSNDRGAFPRNVTGNNCVGNATGAKPQFGLCTRAILSQEVPPQVGGITRGADESFDKEYPYRTIKKASAPRRMHARYSSVAQSALHTIVSVDTFVQWIALHSSGLITIREGDQSWSRRSDL